jgi:hypothetical protein
MTGVFHMSFTMPCPIQETRRRVHYYYVTKKGTTVNRPTEVGMKFTDIHPQTIVPLGPPLARSSTMASSIAATTATIATTSVIADAESQPAKRARIDDPLLESERDQNYWKSPEAAKLFLGIEGSIKRNKKRTDGEDIVSENVDIEHTMAKRIRILKSVQKEPDGWKKIVFSHDIHDACSHSDVFVLRQKSLYLSRAYEVALDKMPFANWNDCCQQAVDELSTFGFALATSSRTIATWNKSFRRSALFPHPNPLVASGIAVENPIFTYFPEAKEKLVTFARENLDDRN